MKDVWVYIASPYSKGDAAMNVRTQMKIWDAAIDMPGVIPIAPLWSHFQHLAFPRPYETWLRYDKSIIERCDVCVRMAAFEGHIKYRQDESPGADAEVALFVAAGKPVFQNLLQLQEWLRTQRGVA